MTERLEGRVAIVTGAGRGVGRAEALLLASEGARIVVNDLGCSAKGNDSNASFAEEVAAEIRAGGGEAIANGDDVATMNGGRNLVEAAMDSFGRLDIIINNAGILRPGTVDGMSEADWDAVLTVNLKGHFTVIRQAAPIFRDQRSGVIVNTASTSGLGHYGMTNYSAAKEGVVGLTRSVARDLGRYNVRCNAIRPGATTRIGIPEVLRTVEFAQRELGFAGCGWDWFDLDGFVGNTAEHSPEQAAVLPVWLCTDAAGNVNGKIFKCGGAEIAIYPEPECIKSLHRLPGWTLDALDAPATRNRLVGDEVNLFAPRD